MPEKLPSFIRHAAKQVNFYAWFRDFFWPHPKKSAHPFRWSILPACRTTPPSPPLVFYPRFVLCLCLRRVFVPAVLSQTRPKRAKPGKGVAKGHHPSSVPGSGRFSGAPRLQKHCFIFNRFQIRQ